MLYVVSGRLRMRWGAQSEFVTEAGPGDFLYMAPYVPHQEIHRSPTEPLQCMVIRSTQESLVVSLEISAVAHPEEVVWAALAHPYP